jgi:hypothetical protein
MSTDQGTAFGTWLDPTSRLIYHDAMPALLSGTPRDGLVLDLGGGNGLAREWFPRLLTVDADPAKEPDVLADVLTWQPSTQAARVLLRYVLHYLPDDDVRRLMAHLASWHRGPVTLIQFVNDDLAAKERNSVNEVRYFRTEARLRSLLWPWLVQRRIAVSYDVDPEFYRNRLNHPHPTSHPETVVAYTLGRSPR